MLAARGIDGPGLDDGDCGIGSEVAEERAAAVAAELADHVVSRVTGVSVFFRGSGDGNLVLSRRNRGDSVRKLSFQPNEELVDLTFMATRLTENAAPDVR